MATSTGRSSSEQRPSRESNEQLGAFQHQPIDASSQIRILHLDPSDPRRDDSPLSGVLKVVNLEDKPTYEALSYAWGGPDKSEVFHLPDGILRITSNLAAGLKELRHSDTSREIWIDAVCINQEDNSEKAKQVPLMATIYREAKCVLVWLGIGNADLESYIQRVED